MFIRSPIFLHKRNQPAEAGWFHTFTVNKKTLRALAQETKAD